jgi:predicted Ser/Thr protein kinase
VANRYSGEAADLVDDLSPLEKLRLYDRGEPPDRLSMSQAKELKNRLPQIYQEADGYPRYEGSCGASARELKTALFNAAQSSEAQCLTPFLVLQELRSLCKDKSIYEFLQQEVVDGYHDHESLIDIVEAECIDLIDREVRDCMGLISETQYRELFEKYIQHVSQWVKGEKVHNRITGEYEKPSETIMKDMELMVMPSDQERGDYRRGLIASIGAFKLDHPQDEVDYGRAFPEVFKKLRDYYFDERKKSLYKNAQNVLKYLSGDQKELSVKEKAQTENALKLMKEKYHYCDHCAKDAVVFLMRKRYTK